MKAVVVGAGPAGLSTAIALRESGVEVEVFDSRTEITAGGGALGLWWNGARALRDLGLSDIVDTHRPVTSAQFHNRVGRNLVNLSPSEFFKDEDPAFIAVPREALQSALLKRLDGVRLTLGSRVEGLSVMPDKVTCYLKDGNETHADLIVGADGMWSSVRRLIFPEARVIDTLETGWTGISDWSLGDSTFHHLADPSGGFFFAPLGDGRTMWGALLKPGVTYDGDRLTEWASEWWSPVGALVRGTPRHSMFPIRAHRLSRLPHFVSDRVALVGDAAHGMVPHLAQGACQSLEDSVMLASSLTPDPCINEALKAYDRARCNTANTVGRLSLLWSQSFYLHDPFLRILGGDGFNGMLRRWVAGQFQKQVGRAT